MLNLRDGADCLDTHLKIASERVKHKPERKGSVLVSLFFSRSRRRDISEGSQVSIIASMGCSSVWETSKSQELWMARGKQLYVHAALWECYKHGGVREADACFGSYEM